MSDDYNPVKRPPVSPNDNAVSMDGKLSKSIPALLAHLVCEAWPDGTVRETSSLTLFTQDRALKACLRDKGNDLVAFVSGPSLEAVLEALEKGLRADSLDWRQDRTPATPKRKK